MAKFLTRIRRAIHNLIFYPPATERVIRDARVRRDPLPDLPTIERDEIRAFLSRTEPTDRDTPVTYTVRQRGHTFSVDTRHKPGERE